MLKLSQFSDSKKHRQEQLSPQAQMERRTENLSQGCWCRKRSLKQKNFDFYWQDFYVIFAGYRQGQHHQPMDGEKNFILHLQRSEAGWLKGDNVEKVTLEDGR